MSKETHKIDADDRCIFDVLNERKYTVDYFQREYSWKKNHIEQLVTDLTSEFLSEHQEGNPRTAVENYSNYYLGPFVVSSKDGMKSIIDGQQRLTSLTLFLIYLNNLQKELGTNETIEPLVFSEKYGAKSFNIQVEERKPCLEKLFLEGYYEPKDGDDESTINMADRYADIEQAFPEELKGKAFPYFLDWLKYNVILVEITAYSDDNAYTIFESMNDRGLNLTSSEMLKGYILSRLKDEKIRDKANGYWKEAMQKVHGFSKEEDQRFFQAWLRSQYADTIRASKAGSSNEDFEKIGTRFHSWFRDNVHKVGLSVDSQEDFQRFVFEDMDFYLKAYLKIIQAQKTETQGLEYVFYHAKWGVAESLAVPLMLSPLRTDDAQEVVAKKINEVAKYLEAFAVRRAVNFRKFGASSIRYTMCTLVKEIRGKDLESLQALLLNKLNEMPETLEGIADFRMHGMNKYFVKFLLARVTAFIEQQAGTSTTFTTYFVSPGAKPFEVEHIWADKFDEHRDEFDQKHEFDTYRNRIGDLVLLPQGTNQSYGAMPYAEKHLNYIKENLLVKSLHPKAYDNNPNFTGMAKKLGLAFEPCTSFGKQDIDRRQALIQDIANLVWA